MKILREIPKEIGMFLRRCWFLVLLLVVALLVYPSVRSSEFWVWTSLSYVTSFVFYVLTIYMPQRRNQKTIHRVIVPYLQKVINDTKSVSASFLAASGYTCNPAKLEGKDFYEIFKRINPLDRPVRLEFLGFTTWFHYLVHQKNQVNRSLDRILTYQNYLETDFILAIETLQNSGLFEIIEVLKDKAVEHTDFSFLAPAYEECYLLVGRLESYLRKYMADV